MHCAAESQYIFYNLHLTLYNNNLFLQAKLYRTNYHLNIRFFRIRRLLNRRLQRLNLVFFAGWCFTHQYKNTTQFCFYAGLAATQNTNQKNLINKMESLNSKEITSGTILSTVLGFSQLPGSFAKSGFAAIEDSPLANKSSEFGCIIYGYKDRRIVILTGYGDNASYVRTIYRDRWNSVGWQSI